MRPEAVPVGKVAVDGRAVALFVLGIIVFGAIVPGGGLLVALAARFTTVRQSKRAMVMLWVVAGVITAIPVITMISFAFPPVATVGPEVVVSD
ncbi:hypothetical protein EDF46_2982 [Frondihabitans sp. PhB188]|uniref:hypothetical protein n=1 Tax=Frondihabitans sp. PhB188 TaxID=2485200 RepID=UPI000FA77BB2|nr:hypothetical protein [Frondihabitans sp. PhB188]ROQ37523.1 hypothetical protein EDF46_2982 [Frondihabitans sp. PhB188]